MTYQKPDTVIYKRKQYALARVNGAGLFNPVDYGIRPRMLSTACWRGFQCTYTIKRSILYLTKAIIGIDKNGIWDELCMNDMPDPIKFTGGLLLANDFIGGYPRMMSAALYGYTTVHELLFDNGKLLAAFDRSMAMEEFRQRIAQQHDNDPWQIAKPDLQDWIGRVFSREYL